MLQVGVIVLGRVHIGHILKVFDFLKTFTKFVCLLGIFRPLENFSLIWRRHHCQ